MSENNNYDGSFIIIDGVVYFDNVADPITIGLEDALLDYDVAKFWNIENKEEFNKKLKILKNHNKK